MVYTASQANNPANCLLTSYPQFMGSSSGDTYIYTMEAVSGTYDPDIIMGGSTLGTPFGGSGI